jgi:hypothetical protein
LAPASGPKAANRAFQAPHFWEGVASVAGPVRTLAASDPKFDKLQVHVVLFARKLAWIYGGYNYARIYRIHTYTYIYIYVYKGNCYKDGMLLLPNLIFTERSSYN